ncbi:MAG TPA: hypothetical protein VLF15_00790, partial [Pseudoxanthomonas sp.]|nr:hypothetical protein [Pseudoxanthomonas sp.]
MPTQTASADASQAAENPSLAERIVSVLGDRLPAGAALAVCWRDWALGSGGAVSPDAPPQLRRRAEQALSDHHGSEPIAPDLLLQVWDNDDSNARIAVAAQLPVPLAAEEQQSWLTLAQAFIAATLDAARAQARVVSLEKSKRLQQALYEIADLASADLEMPEMLRRIHAVVGSLMYAENCYIVLYD